MSCLLNPDVCARSLEISLWKDFGGKEWDKLGLQGGEYVAYSEIISNCSCEMWILIAWHYISVDCWFSCKGNNVSWFLWLWLCSEYHNTLLIFCLDVEPTGCNQKLSGHKSPPEIKIYIIRHILHNVKPI